VLQKCAGFHGFPRSVPWNRVYEDRARDPSTLGRRKRDAKKLYYERIRKRDEDCGAAVLRRHEKLPVNWGEYHRDFVSCHGVVDLPSYSWDLMNHWIQYEHNWCLTKGNVPEEPVLVAAPKKPIRLSASVQAIIEQVVEEQHGSIVIQSDLHDPELLPVAQGHRVNGLILIIIP
jgi:hypothetical protein